MNFFQSRPSKPRGGGSNPSGRTPDIAGPFWARVDQSAAGSCWPWTGRTDRDGYGLVDRGGKICRASRVALELALGRQLGTGEVARHSDACTTRACCRPDHLRPGTQAENIADRDAAGRTQKGERHWRARLTAEQAEEVRRLSGAGVRQRDIAARFGVGREAVSKIARGKTWRSATFDARARGLIP